MTCYTYSTTARLVGVPRDLEKRCPAIGGPAVDGATTAATVERAVLRAAGETADRFLRGHSLRREERGCSCGASERPDSQPLGLKFCRDQLHDFTRSTLATATARATATATAVAVAVAVAVGLRRTLCLTLCITLRLGLAEHERRGGEQRATLLQHSKCSHSKYGHSQYSAARSPPAAAST